ncbi:MAG: hypothetical protein PHU36_01085 [Syntrophomonadaceae bacterium]|nr:hypothetical protein [Syntrophomonadaceae bacterium]
MKMYVGITDYDWFKTLKQANCEEVNFWKPGGRTNFRALDEGNLFLFKLHSPKDYIVGGGFFLKYSILPSSLAWDAFGIANGANSLLGLNNQRAHREHTGTVLMCLCMWLAHENRPCVLS